MFWHLACERCLMTAFFLSYSNRAKLAWKQLCPGKSSDFEATFWFLLGKQNHLINISICLGSCFAYWISLSIAFITFDQYPFYSWAHFCDIIVCRWSEYACSLIFITNIYETWIESSNIKHKIPRPIVCQIYSLGDCYPKVKISYFILCNMLTIALMKQNSFVFLIIHLLNDMTS